MTAQQYYENGEALLAAKKHAEAIVQYQKATELAADWAAPFYGLGLCHYWLGEYEIAKEWHEKAMRLKPDWEKPYDGIGNYFRTQSNNETAKNWYEQAIERNPDWERPYCGLGDCFSGMGDYETAKGWFQQAIDRKPDWQWPYDGMGECFRMLGDYETAKGWFQQSIERNPNLEISYYRMGKCCSALKDYEVAKGWHQQAIDKNPDWENSYFEIGECFRMQGNYETAKAWHQCTIDRNPKWASPYCSMGECFKDQNDYETAKGLYQLSIERSPDYIEPYNGMGECFMMLGDYETAKGWFQQAIDRNADNALPYWGIGACHLFEQLFEKALNLFNQAIALNGKIGTFYLYRGRTYNRLQQHAEALEDLKRSVYLKRVSLVTIEYLLQYDTPFLINRLLSNFPKFSQLMDLQADIAASQAAAKPYLLILSFLDKPESTPAERLAWWQLKALVTYQMGDSPDAFILYDGIIDELGMSLQDHYYYYLSAQDFGEKNPNISAYGLKAIDQIQNFTDNDHYYAGLLYNLNEDTANAKKKLEQIQNPVLHHLSLALLAEQATDWDTADNLYRQIDALQADDFYQALFTGKPLVHIASEPTSSTDILKHLRTPLYHFELRQAISAYWQHVFPHSNDSLPTFYEILQIDEVVKEALEMADRTNWLATLFESMAHAFEQSAASVTAQNLAEAFINTPLGHFKEQLSDKWNKWKVQNPADWPNRFENSLALEIQQEKIAVADWGIVFIYFLQQAAITSQQAMRLLLYAIKINEFGLDEGHFSKEQIEGGKAAGSLVEGAVQLPFQKVISVITKASFLNLFRSAEAKDKRNSQMVQLHVKKDDYLVFKQEYLGYLSLFQERIQRTIAEVYLKEKE